MTDQRGLTKRQVRRLVQAIDPKHVDAKQGKAALSYMAQHEVRAELTRIFGYGNWDAQTEEMTFLWEKEYLPGEPGYPKNPQSGNPPYYRACYMARVRVNIRDYWGNPVASFVGAHAEANSTLPDQGEAHAMAVSSVESYALRRAVISLGDRLGLGLYDGGSQAALIKGTLQLLDPESPQYVSDEERAAEAAKAKVAAEERAARMQGALNNTENPSVAG